jgi:hypothetical protein
VDAFSLVVDGKVTQVGGFDLTSVLSPRRSRRSALSEAPTWTAMAISKDDPLSGFEGTADCILFRANRRCLVGRTHGGGRPVPSGLLDGIPDQDGDDGDQVDRRNGHPTDGDSAQRRNPAGHVAEGDCRN